MKKLDSSKKTLLKICSISMICIVVILLILNIVIKNNNTATPIAENKELEVQKIINNLGAEFISIKQSDENNFKYDIYLKFKEDLYENDESNEVLYTNLMSQVIGYLGVSTRFIDESRNLIIRVTYVPKEYRYYYTINGEEDYFIKHNSLNSLKNFKIYDNVDISIDSDILEDVISNNWEFSKDIFGTKDSNFEDYDIYFDEGYQVKKSGNKIVNIIFDKKYKNKIANNVKVTDTKEKIKKAFGDPIFSYEDIIGYKNEDIYIFFYNEQVSVYRNENYDCEEFENILDKYIKNEINVKEFINELTYLWSDYSRYSYSSEYVDLQYANQGVGIYLTNTDQKGITIYNNYSSIDTISKLIKDGLIKADLETDAVFNEEKNRISRDQQRFQENLSKEEYIGDSSNFIEIIKNSRVEFYSKNDNYPSCRLIDNINSYFWYSDNIFVYSVQGKGIYYFDLENQESFEILSGEDNFKFNNFEDGIINYDENKILEIGSE